MARITCPGRRRTPEPALATEQGIAVCVPIYDALLVEGNVGEIGDVVIATHAAMAKASRDVLGGLEIGTDVCVVAYPDRYADLRAAWLTRWVCVGSRYQARVLL